MALDISLYLDRIALLQQTAVSNSVAYPYYLIQQRNDLYFANRLASISSTSISSFQRRYDIEVQSVLRTALITSNVQTAYYEIELQQYIIDVLEYFQDRPSLTVNAEPTSEKPLTSIVPRSLNITSQGVQQIAEGNQTAIGAFFTYQFSVNLRGDS